MTPGTGSSTVATASAVAKDDPHKEFVKGGVVVSIVRCLGIASTVGITAALGRVLTEADFGWFALLASLAAFASIVAQFGLNRSLVRFLAQSLALQEPSAARMYAYRGSIIAAASISVTAIAWFFGVQFLPSSDQQSLLWVAGLSTAWFVLMTIHQLVGEMLRGLGKPLSATLLSGINGGPLANCLCLMAVVMAASSGGLTLVAVLQGFVLSFLAVTPLGLYWLQRSMSAAMSCCRSSHPDRESASMSESFAHLLWTSCSLMLIQALSFCVIQGDLWIAGAELQSGDDLAMYGAARRVVPLLTMPLQLGSIAIVPIIASLHAQNRLDDLRSLVKRAANLCFIPSILPFVVILLSPALLLQWFVGPRYGDAANILLILALGQMVLSWSGVHGMVLMMVGEERVFLIHSVVFCALLFGMGLLGARFFGVVGLAWAASGTLMVQSITSVLITRIRTGVWANARW